MNEPSSYTCLTLIFEALKHFGELRRSIANRKVSLQSKENYSSKSGLMHNCLIPQSFNLRSESVTKRWYLSLTAWTTIFRVRANKLVFLWNAIRPLWSPLSLIFGFSLTLKPVMFLCRLCPKTKLSLLHQLLTQWEKKRKLANASKLIKYKLNLNAHTSSRYFQWLKLSC